MPKGQYQRKDIEDMARRIVELEQQLVDARAARDLWKHRHDKLLDNLMDV